MALLTTLVSRTPPTPSSTSSTRDSGATSNKLSRAGASVLSVCCNHTKKKKKIKPGHKEGAHRRTETTSGYHGGRSAGDWITYRQHRHAGRDRSHRTAVINASAPQTSPLNRASYTTEAKPLGDHCSLPHGHLPNGCSRTSPILPVSLLKLAVPNGGTGTRQHPAWVPPYHNGGKNNERQQKKNART